MSAEAATPTQVSPATEPHVNPVGDARTRPAPIVAIANQKGGVGKTTTSVSTAAAMARSGWRVLLVDFDPQGNATSSLGINKPDLALTSYHVLVGACEAREAIISSGRAGLDLLPTNSTLAGAEVELVDLDRREHQLADALAPVVRDYDVILIDCPPSLGLLTINALTAAQSVIIPIQCEFLPLEGVTQLRDTIERVRQHLNPGLTITGVLMTMYDARTRLSAQVVEEVRRHYQNLVFETVIPRSVRLAEAPSYGLAITEYDGRSNGAMAYERLSEEIATRLNRNRDRSVPLETAHPESAAP